MQKVVIILVILIALTFGAFLIFKSLNINSKYSGNNSTNANMAIPGFANCINQGGKLEFATKALNGKKVPVGICSFPDGRSCEEGDFFRTKICE